MSNKLSRFNRMLDFAVLFFIFSGGLYFLYYLLQSSKPLYLLFSVFIYLTSFFIRHFLIKRGNKTGFTEIGLLFVSITFLAYTLYIFKLDQNIAEYLPERILTNSGAVFIVLLVMSLLPKGKSGRLSIFAIFALLVAIVFQGGLNSIFSTYPWAVSLVIGTPYIYLLSVLTGIHKLRATDNSLNFSKFLRLLGVFSI